MAERLNQDSHYMTIIDGRVSTSYGRERMQLQVSYLSKLKSEIQPQRQPVNNALCLYVCLELYTMNHIPYSVDKHRQLRKQVVEIKWCKKFSPLSKLYL